MRWRVALAALALISMGRIGEANSAHKQSNLGDSISQGFDANDVPADQPKESWAQGTDPAVDSVYLRHRVLDDRYSQQPESVSGSEMVGGADNFAAQAARVCAQATRPELVEVLLGGNDVCNRPVSTSEDAASNLYSVETWRSALRAGMDELAACLPPGAEVQILSAPRVDFLYEAGHAKWAWCAEGVWPLGNICRIVTGENDPVRRAQIGARIDQYNDALAAEVQGYDGNVDGRNPRGVIFSTDWVGSIAGGHPASSVGTYRFGPGDINWVDCFHPNVLGQARLACAAFASSREGAGDVADCLQ